jgi:hypothetical protein
MSNPLTFINSYSQRIVALVQDLETLRTMNDQIDQDPTLLDRYFALNPNQIRQDITKQDVTDVHDAIVQMLFTFDSGSPPQKSYLFKMLP